MWPAGPGQRSPPVLGSGEATPQVLCSVWTPQDKKDIEVLESVWRRAVKPRKSLEQSSEEEQLREFGWLSLEKRRFRRDLILLYHSLTGRWSQVELFLRAMGENKRWSKFRGRLVSWLPCPFYMILAMTNLWLTCCRCFTAALRKLQIQWWEGQGVKVVQPQAFFSTLILFIQKSVNRHAIRIISWENVKSFICISVTTREIIKYNTAVSKDYSGNSSLPKYNICHFSRECLVNFGSTASVIYAVHQYPGVHFLGVQALGMHRPS